MHHTYTGTSVHAIFQALSSATEKSLLEQCALMIEKLQANKNKVPSLTQDKMLANAWSFLTVDSTATFKSLLVTNTLDGSGDHLVSGKCFYLIGTDIMSFRAKLLTQQHLKSLEGIVRKLIPPKGIKRKEFVGT